MANDIYYTTVFYDDYPWQLDPEIAKTGPRDKSLRPKPLPLRVVRPGSGVVDDGAARDIAGAYGALDAAFRKSVGHAPENVRMSISPLLRPAYFVQRPADAAWDEESHPMTRQRCDTKVVAPKYLLNRPNTYVEDGLLGLKEVEAQASDYMVYASTTIDILRRELHPSTLTFEFWIAHGRHKLGYYLRYQDLWDACPVHAEHPAGTSDQQLYTQDCLNCPLRGVECLWSNTLRALEQPGEYNVRELLELYAHSTQSMIEDIETIGCVPALDVTSEGRVFINVPEFARTRGAQWSLGPTSTLTAMLTRAAQGE